ncbi:MAG: hypothetical protein A3B99_00580 [Candidatus Yanofskybacteria bacterium RIFCSPHIGHO2_02_FULL_44_12b]|uniref:Uncharacterized protein n=1 Tax=Candidatus Yanofskybacteria bacterium GW2011_GWA2_44_9 TaxID=1619025 RepID=A0A0G1KDK0_9BACT|nr:MAG: hypothetical protein UW79_C0016G0017 [Candidatus Yanofskybacteria bacterium GW2011_GWA2_44_9]OGN15976.1 MAG: hypothetical protein A3B99_00580 [Candidatus Yanofskybacteria bacterium RIFCSPHIGHO2_02_FULL_44_12b]
MGRERKIRKFCTKDHPFIPPLKDDEIWEHVDAFDKFPERDLAIVTFHCPNCGIDIHVDMS